MATPYKITITKAGVSTDLFNILYDVVGNSNYNTASSPCGTPATLLTQAQLISGFTVSLPDNAVNVYIQDIGGICDGRVTLVLLPGRPTPTVTPSPTVTGTPTPSPSPSTTPNPTPSPSPSTTPGPTPSPSPSTTPNPTPSPSPSTTPGPTPSPSPSTTPNPTPSPSPSPTPSPSPSPTVTGTPTPSPTPTPTLVPNFNVRLCSGTTTYVMRSNGLNPVVDKVYTMQDLSESIPGMNGANCWQVLSSTTASADSTNVSINTEYVDCGSCTAVFFTAYTGSSLNNACGGTITTQIYHRGTLGVGTILYEDLGLTIPIVPIKYVNDTANSQVYLVGTPSDENGEVTEIVYCPTPTPTPTLSPSTYFLYVSNTSGANACAGGNITTPGIQFEFTGNSGQTFCTTTSIFSVTGIITTYDLDTFWVSDGTNSRQFTRSGGLGSETATPDAVCVICPTPTPSATPAPSPTTTPGPTPTPTVTPNPTPTSTPFVHTYSLGSVTSGGGYGACDEFAFLPVNFFSFSSPIGNNVVLYTNNNMNILAANGFYSNGVNFWQITDGNGTLTGQTSCIPPTPSPTPNPSPSVTPNPPTPSPSQTPFPTPTPSAFVYTYQFGYNALNGPAACDDGTPNTYYSFLSSLYITNDAVIYTSNDMLPASLAPNGYYSDGTYYWRIISNNGTFTGETSCTPPTPTPSPSQTPGPTPTPSPVYYQLIDCGNSSVHYSIAYPPGTFTNSLRCTAVSSGFPTRTVVITGFTTTTPPDPLYTLTSQGANNCAATPTPTTTPVPTSTPNPTPTPTPAPPTYNYLVNGAASVSVAAACSAVKNIYLWSYGSTFTDGTTYYEGNSVAPTIPLVVYVGGDRWKSDGSVAVQIDNNGYATSVTNCPTPIPTPEPTAIPAQFGMSSGTTGANACSNWNNLVNRATYYAASGTPALANGVLLYTTVDLNPANIIPEGIYSDGSNYWSVSAFSGVLNGQSTCATPNPTATPVPTPSPTPNPTATPSPTPNPTATPQPTISVNFHTSQPSGYLACDGGTSISIQINGSTFCNSTVYTSSYFTGLGTNNFWLSYDGNYRQIFHNSGANTATQAGSCQTCNNTPPATPEPTPSPTPAPTATPGTWSMVNTSGDVDVSGMTINSAVVVTSGAFPSTPSTTILGTCQTGTNTLVLTFVTSNLPYQSITVIDSNGAVQTQSVPSGYAAAVNFPNVFINTTTQIQIIITETPPATPVPTPEPTPNPTATPEPTPVPTQAPTPEPTPEPTATSAPTVYYYTANKYYGDGTCGLYANNVVVYSTFSVPFNTWACGDTGYMYFITGETSAGSYDADLVSTKSDCSDGCP